MRLLEQIIDTADDVFAVRQRARQVAAIVGFEAADQVRVATALSELGRDLLGERTAGAATFEVEAQTGLLVIRVTGFDTADPQRLPGLDAARRLLGSLDVQTDDSGRTVVVMRRSLPRRITSADVAAMREQLASLVVTSPLDELRAQNRELLTTLEEVTARHAEVVQLNNELEATNRGVMAMYTELSEELETTNQGVVALYAELDDKSRQLQAAAEAKTRFMNSVSHELRSPVNSVLALARLMLDPTDAPLVGEQRRQAELMVGSASELLDLVNQLLDLARAESGVLPHHAARFDLRAMLDDVADALRPLASAGVELRVAAPAEPWTIDSDETLIRQIVRNLVTNALAFTPTGHVQIALEARGEETTIAVSDTGIGIAPEHLDRVFEEFYQVPGELQTERKGTGLGLPYARRVGERLGGTLTARSTVGVGSTFELRLPLARQPPVGPSTSHGGPPHVDRALIVDDDDRYRALLARLLRPFAEHIIELSDGTGVIDHAARLMPDVIFLDLAMPGMTGREVLAELAADARLRKLPVVIVTSMDVSAVDRDVIGHARAVLRKHELSSKSVESTLASLRSSP